MGRSKLFEKRLMPKKQASLHTGDRSQHKHNQLKANDLSDSTDDTHQTKHMDSMDFQEHLGALYEKRASIREKALFGFVDAFEGRMLNTFVEQTYLTLLYRYLNSIKIGSANEAYLASRAIGLLAITVGRGSSAHELMKDSMSKLYEVHKSGSDLLKRSVTGCLAIITFVGANDLGEVEESMKILWETCHPISGSTAGYVNEPTTTEIAAAISAWSFLLASTNRWRFSSKSWLESIPFLSTLLEKADGPLRVVVVQAIALILEIESSRKEDGVDVVDRKGSTPKGSAYAELLKNKILTELMSISAETGGCLELSMRIAIKNGIQKVVTWSQLIQITYLKHYLGKSFLKHMQENDLFHGILELPKKSRNLVLEEKEICKSQYLLTSKQKTRLRNECRIRAQDMRLGYGHYDVTCLDE